MAYNGYLIDLDGTIFRGEKRIDGAQAFIDYLHTESIPYLFLTNNSTYTEEMIVQKLNHLGINAFSNQILTSAIATAKYIKKNHADARCYVIGETGLQQALLNEDLVLMGEHCDYVVVGLDREISYEKLANACLYIREGAHFIVTNKDVAIPTEQGLLPGNGAIAASIAVSTGVQPTYIGKPEAIMMEEAMKLLGVQRETLLMIGDNYHTDIMAGINVNIDTLLVLTGYSKREDLEHVNIQPTYVTNNLLDWLDELKRFSK